MIIIVFIGLVIFIAMLCIVSLSSKCDDVMAQHLIAREAQKKHPTMSYIESIDALYKETLIEINQKRQNGIDTEELEEKLILLINERNKYIIHGITHGNKE